MTQANCQWQARRDSKTLAAATRTAHCSASGPGRSRTATGTGMLTWALGPVTLAVPVAQCRDQWHWHSESLPHGQPECHWQ